jgi:hypothetical protein
LWAGRGESAAARDEYVRALSLEPNLEEARAGLAALEESAPERDAGEAGPESGSGDEQPEPEGVA